MPSSQLALVQAAKKRAAKLEAKGKQVDFKELLRMEPDSFYVSSFGWPSLTLRGDPGRCRAIVADCQRAD